MNRDYADGQSSSVVFFQGVEVEHTPAYGMNTLFVVGVQSVNAAGYLCVPSLRKVTQIILLGLISCLIIIFYITFV